MTAHESASNQLTVDDIVPMALWGKNHWSMLAYMETVIVEMAGFEVGFDARMTQNRRNFRVMAEANPKPGRPGRTVNMAFAKVMDEAYSTKLNDGQQVLGHDDWCCVQDIAAHGLLTATTFEPKDKLKLSQLGQEASAALRAQKQGGGKFADFKFAVDSTSKADGQADAQH